MGWSPDSATSAYLDTIKLCNLDHQRRHTSARHTEPHSTEFISALAAGMNAKLILEVCGRAAQTTIALAAAARQTGGRLICLLSRPDSLLDTMVAMKELGLAGYVEFIVGEAEEMIPQFADVDFALIDCKQEDYVQYFNLLRLNPARAVVVADNLFDRKATAAYGRIVKRRPGARSITLPIGKGIEVTRLTRVDSAVDKSSGGGGAEAAVTNFRFSVVRSSRRNWACDEGQNPRRAGRKGRFRIE